ncbi:MAG: sarcosine oxidase subunit gamma [Streptosporangiales bacterium]|nr:sarcosine oxidase subunit gamma [Streptosporangiales bacterium]
MTTALDRRRSPLAVVSDRLAATGSADTVTFAERPFRVQLEVRAGAMLRPGVLDDALGLHPPAEVGTVARRRERHVLCLAPSWWLVTDEPEREPRLECALAELVRTAGGIDVSAVDVSAQRTTIDVAGPSARDVLAHGCSLDLHPSAFTVDSCAQTTLAKAQVVLQQLDDAPTYRVHVRASFADYLAHWLLDAATEYVH